MGILLVFTAARPVATLWPGPAREPGPLTAKGLNSGHSRPASPPLSQGRLYLLGYCLDLNRATSQELALLPGIGPKRAQAIINTRVERGGFRSLGELQAIPGWGPSLTESLRPLVCFDPPTVP